MFKAWKVRHYFEFDSVKRDKKISVGGALSVLGIRPIVMGHLVPVVRAWFALPAVNLIR